MLDRYQLGHEVGTGARGAVYRARDRETGRVVAIKLVADTAAGGRAVGDARSIGVRSGSLHHSPVHPNIPAVYDTKRAGRLRYWAIEFADGRDLRPYTRPTTRLPLPTVLSIMICIGDALHLLHRQGFVHGDVKPANILFDSATAMVKLVDVGYVRSGHRLRYATPAYMAPEQVRGDVASGATDLYAAAVTIYELVTGRLPFSARSRPDIMRRIVHEPHVDVRGYEPSLPADLAQLLDKLLQKDSGRRPSTKEFRHDLRKIRDAVSSYSPTGFEPRTILGVYR